MFAAFMKTRTSYTLDTTDNSQRDKYYETYSTTLPLGPVAIASRAILKY
jgi:hypothetical protein